jgi:phage terminase large subunit-like protein
MNNSQNFLKDALKKLEKRFIGINLKYAYDTLTEYHIIEVKPEEIRRGNTDYKKVEIQLWTDFMKQYPNEDLLICAPSDTNDMSNMLFETK